MFNAGTVRPWTPLSPEIETVVVAVSIQTTPKVRKAGVQFSDPESPGGVEITTSDFLQQCRLSALARFRSRSDSASGCHTIEHVVPPKLGDRGPTGSILVHVSSDIMQTWERSAPGDPPAKHAHVVEQLHLALEDLADQDVHGFLALTDEQRAIFVPDLVQLVQEALERTSFAKLTQKPIVNWEGTLVKSVRPPYLVLVISIGT